ncbi:helix-turn-helix domain-containing protein [Roseateles sp. SL47]|uniref:helix-turn-helix domain-containing protein n=1 Tax=Roseateles sp. SL47 TaxID=2995138 RepID=UPI00226FEC90|nr:helix-turn-helix domain-containing protein [Roseateles sp. SL47]WAC72767.1 helix-turn-helix domain-containing protein [Roseateles sp. SL47]
MTSTAADEAPAALDAAISSEVTAGAALRRAREARGLHIAALAATLKVPQSKLEALEGDRYKELPDATFARALARSMCRVLKIDAEPVLAMLPRGGNEASLDRVTPGLNQPFRERASSQEPLVSLALLKSPVLLGGAALLVAALAVYLVPTSMVEDVTRRFHREPETTAQPGTTTEPLQVEAPTVPASAPMVSETASVIGGTAGTSGTQATTAQTTSGPASAQTVVANTSPTTPQSPSSQGAAAPGSVSPAPTASPATTSATTPATLPATTPPPATATAPATNPAAATPAGAGLLRVRATADTWVEVVDSHGQSLLSRLLRSGEQVDLNGTAPLKLRVGNVSGTELVFRGKPVDLASRARDNVARLELN